MKLIPFAREATDDPKLEAIQDNLQRFFKALEDNPHLNGTNPELGDIPFLTSPLKDGEHITEIAANALSVFTVSHTLGRVPIGVICTKAKNQGSGAVPSPALAWDSADAKEITLYHPGTAPSYLDIWIF